MYAALAYGGAVPNWFVVLQAAEAWGTPPWEIARAPASARWLRRWQLVEKHRTTIANHRAEADRANRKR